MNDRSERLRASAVITALLSDDMPLAWELVEQDDDPRGLARGAVALAAGIWDHFASRTGSEPSDAWAASLLKWQTVKE